MRNASQSISIMNNLNELEVAYFTDFNANGTKVQAYLNTKESVKLLKKKGFDCVAMKNDVQARVQEDYAGLSDEQERARMAQELSTSDDVVARKWRRLRERQQAAAEYARE